VTINKTDHLSLFMLVITIFCIGCTSFGQLAPKTQPPQVNISSSALLTFSVTGADLFVTLNITNPNLTPIDLSGWDYVMQIEDKQLRRGIQRNGIRIQAMSSNESVLVFTIRAEEIRNIASHHKEKAALNYQVNTTVVINSPITGRQTIPVVATGQIPVHQITRLTSAMQ